MAQPPSYNAAVSDEKYPTGPPYPSYQNNAYPPPAQGAYPPPTQGAYPPAYSSQNVGENVPYQYPEYDQSADDVESGYRKQSQDEMVGIVSFDNKSLRLGFIRKVFAILSLQMAVTVAMSALFIFHKPIQEYVKQNLALYLSAYVLFLVLYIVLACCTSVARKHPINLILLALFTLTLSYMVAVISSFHETEIVMLAFGMTMICSFAIIIFASQTKYDITVCSGALFIACISLFLFGLFAAIFVPSGSIKIVNIVYSSLGAMLFMAFLAFDTQLIMGGKKHEISPEDYVFAAMMLYVDIVYIFLFILSIFGNN